MARYPNAQWRPIPVNYSTGPISPRFLVVHAMEGTLEGTDSWFRNPSAQASAHFGIGKSGVVYQWVNTANKAWHAAGANPVGIGVEMEMHVGESLTQAQVVALGELFAWAHKTYHALPLRRATGPFDAGLIGHSQGGAAWGGHNDPGPRVYGQFPAIIAAARGTRPPDPKPPSLQKVDDDEMIAAVAKPDGSLEVFVELPSGEVMHTWTEGAGGWHGEQGVTSHKWETLGNPKQQAK